MWAPELVWKLSKNLLSLTEIKKKLICLKARNLIILADTIYLF
jgi:hypothetical protein